MSEEGWIVYASYVQWVRTNPLTIEEATFWMSIEEMRRHA